MYKKGQVCGHFLINPCKSTLGLEYDTVAKASLFEQIHTFAEQVIKGTRYIAYVVAHMLVQSRYSRAFWCRVSGILLTHDNI